MVVGRSKADKNTKQPQEKQKESRLRRQTEHLARFSHELKGPHVDKSYSCLFLPCELALWFLFRNNISCCSNVCELEHFVPFWNDKKWRQLAHNNLVSYLSLALFLMLRVEE